MLSIKLAFKNLFGAGLRTWLNVTVLSFSFFVIVFYNGMLDGWNRQATLDSKKWETGNGQLWHKDYDRYDPFTLQDAHGLLPESILDAVHKRELTPILMTQASIYPQGRMLNIILKGIDPDQSIVAIPTKVLQGAVDTGEITALIGKKMAASSALKKGDRVTLQWRDKNGTFDARDILIADVFDTSVPTVDQGQVWIPLNKLQEMTGLHNEATLLVAGNGYEPSSTGVWQFKDAAFLLRELQEIIDSKRGSSMIIYGMLMAIALLAIFDTQVLSIFRRQKEIGTLIALGMTRMQVVKIFTVEGSTHSLLAIALTAIYGIPLLGYLQSVGIPMPQSASQSGLAISERIIPFYSLGMILITVSLVIVSSTIVSYFPSRRISGMNPTDALKGKIQ